MRGRHVNLLSRVKLACLIVIVPRNDYIVSDRLFKCRGIWPSINFFNLHRTKNQVRMVRLNNIPPQKTLLLSSYKTIMLKLVSIFWLK